jgi:acyl carrier protein|tara:strand:+ start:214 stop:444 length:231 start_codon:yes stop_codon:yes gene_type:complete
MDDVEIKKIFLQVFPDLEESEFNWKKKQNDYENWDSFSHLNLITLIEEKFNISISDDDVIELKSAEMILNFIERNK